MSEHYLFHNRYRIKSNRLQGYDYRFGRFFVTICTKNREHYFGEIKNGRMVLSDVGIVVNKCLMDVLKRFPYVNIDEYVIMPNHVHAVIVVDGHRNDYCRCGDVGCNDRDAINRVSTYNKTNNKTNNKMNNKTHNHMHNKMNNHPNNKIGGITGNHNIMLHPTCLGNIIRSYKSTCTYIINTSKLGKFARQSNYYDHIIRNDKKLYAIRKYIRDNPKKWYRDRNNHQNLYM